MGTETETLICAIHKTTENLVKLNNPLKGTETRRHLQIL